MRPNDRSIAGLVAYWRERVRFMPARAKIISNCASLNGNFPPLVNRRAEVSNSTAASPKKMYSEKTRPRLANVRTCAIRSRLGISWWYANKIRQGYRPHPRHWEALVELAGGSP